MNIAEFSFGVALCALPSRRTSCTDTGEAIEQDLLKIKENVYSPHFWLCENV